ncbi:MAG: glycosyltransferase family 1 protein, partial [Acidobacteria bacterium]|nr:glycosyltransferase family 1 protein [Acidobacteriota bacterium]
AIPLVAAKTGIGHYTDALAEALARIHTDHQYSLLSPFDFHLPPAPTTPPNLSKIYLPVRSVFRRWWLVGLPALLQISPFDLFHGTNYCIPVFAPCPTVVTVHDLSLFRRSATHEDDNVRRGKRRIPLMIRRASRIIAPSEWTRREILEHFNVRPELVRVIPEGARRGMRPIEAAECTEVLRKHQITSPYLLFVGTIEPRKNLPVLLRAYDELLRSTPHCPQLILCGGNGWKNEDVYRLVEELKLTGMVRFAGYVEDEDLPALYSAAECFLYPSEYEGFGLPPLEAMACGTPVITSNTTSLPEVVGEAGLTHSPNDHQGLASLIVRVLGENGARAHFRNSGLERSRLFSWDRAARETQALYDEVFIASRKVRRA